MDDVISRQAAIDALDRIFDRCEEIEAHLPEGDPDRTGYKMFPDYMIVWKYLHPLPSAEPERKTGKWVATPNGFHYCSNCRMGADYDNYGHEVLRDFCPNCGAKMVEDDPSHPFADDVMMGERRKDG